MISCYLQYRRPPPPPHRLYRSHVQRDVCSAELTLTHVRFPEGGWLVPTSQVEPKFHPGGCLIHISAASCVAQFLSCASHFLGRGHLIISGAELPLLPPGAQLCQPARSSHSTAPQRVTSTLFPQLHASTPLDRPPPPPPTFCSSVVPPGLVLLSRPLPRCAVAECPRGPALFLTRGSRILHCHLQSFVKNCNVNQRGKRAIYFKCYNRL